MSPATAADYKITDGQEVYVETDRDRARRHAQVDDRIADGVILVPHGWHGEGNCNLLTDCRAESREPIMGYPTWKSLLNTLKPVEETIPASVET
jgi:anaerobic selenocysteine-containing dehydrogenase